MSHIVGDNNYQRQKCKTEQQKICYMRTSFCVRAKLIKEKCNLEEIKGS